MEVGIPFLEGKFDLNDWFLLILIFINYVFLFLLPKRFNLFTSLFVTLYGIVVAGIFDNTIGAHIFDYYDIMDGGKYTVMDIVLYLLYGPYGYYFIYFYDKLNIKGMKAIGYILIWAIFGITFEDRDIHL